MADFTITVRPGHPDFLDLDWTRSVDSWDSPRIVDLPRGISRHVVRFVSYRQGIYAVKELPTALAHRDYQVLRDLETEGAPAVMPVGLIDHRAEDSTAEVSAALITKYEDFSSSTWREAWPTSLPSETLILITPTSPWVRTSPIGIERCGQNSPTHR